MGHHVAWALEEYAEVSLLNDITRATHVGVGRFDHAFASKHLRDNICWSLHPHLTSDHYGVILDFKTVTIPPPPRPARLNMRAADWTRFQTTTKAFFTNEDNTLTLREYATAMSSNILQAAQIAIPLAKTPPAFYRDRWIYGRRVKELSRRVSAARKHYRRHPCPATRQYLASVVQHAHTTKQKLRREEWLKWSQSLKVHTTLGKCGVR